MHNDEKATKKGIVEKELQSWIEFIDFVRDPIESWGTLIYRGQANSEWEVTSTLDRLEKRFPTTPNLEKNDWDYFKRPRVDRKRQLERFKEMARGKLASQIPDAEDDEWWALAQHHGMSTPMLDWTYSPFVALYFAFEDEKCSNRTPDKRAVFALSHHLIPADKASNTHPKPFAPSWPGNYRLTNQGGLFLKMPQSIDLEKYIKKEFKDDTYGIYAGGKGNPHPKTVLKKFIIPNSKKDRFECLRFLDHMNINRVSLFPDLDGAARYINNLWEINWDKALGFINDISCRPSEKTK
ncbi:MAG: FRG domain-containing protein [Sedimentisphaerales bacterium]|nr:FRG domain-containing protein [Sedimentisphaerales bacterium]